MAKQTIIDITPTPRNGLRGRLEKLFVEYSGKATALRIAAEILEEHDRRDAIAAAPKKIAAALKHRPMQRLPAAKPKPAKGPLSGKVLTLFLLEHLAQDTPRTPTELQTAITQTTGAAIGLRGFMGTIAGVLPRHGFVKSKGGAFLLTAKGATKAIAMREQLEQRKMIPAGGYMVR